MIYVCGKCAPPHSIARVAMPFQRLPQTCDRRMNSSLVACSTSGRDCHVAPTYIAATRHPDLGKISAWQRLHRSSSPAPRRVRCSATGPDDEPPQTPMNALEATIRQGQHTCCTQTTHGGLHLASSMCMQLHCIVAWVAPMACMDPMTSNNEVCGCTCGWRMRSAIRLLLHPVNDDPRGFNVPPATNPIAGANSGSWRWPSVNSAWRWVRVV